MSWQRARKEAQRWLDTLNLPLRQMNGQTINLSDQAKALRYNAKFLAMIIRAAKRILKSRGVDAIIDEPQPLGGIAPDDLPGE